MVEQSLVRYKEHEKSFIERNTVEYHPPKKKWYDIFNNGGVIQNPSYEFKTSFASMNYNIWKIWGKYSGIQGMRNAKLYLPFHEYQTLQQWVNAKDLLKHFKK